MLPSLYLSSAACESVKAPDFSAVMVVPVIVATSVPDVMLYAPVDEDLTSSLTSIVPFALGVHAVL